MSEFRSPSFETIIIYEIPSACELEQEIVIAPGEGKQPVQILNDKFCEELAYPHLSPSQHFNQQLLHYNQIVLVDRDNMFFARSVLQKAQLSNQINIAMKKNLE